jgi:uncharacterized coiled-coil DUF342 family protein
MSKKDEYMQKMHAKLDEWSAEINKLKAKMDSAKAEKRIEYRKHIDDLQEKRKAFRDKIDKLGKAGEGAWEDLKTGVESAWHTMENTIKAARSRFK